MNYELIQKHINPTLVVDCGAHCGFFYKEAKSVWPDAEFLLIEGNEECRDELEALHVPYKIAVLSDTQREVTFYTTKECPKATGCSYYREKTHVFDGRNGVPHVITTTTLDDVMHNIPYPGKEILLKLDTQGSELDILHGAQKFLKHVKAVALEVAFSEYNEGAPMANDVAIAMTDFGFMAMETLDRHVHPFDNSRHIQSDILYVRVSA